MESQGARGSQSTCLRHPRFSRYAAKLAVATTQAKTFAVDGGDFQIPVKYRLLNRGHTG